MTKLSPVHRLLAFALCMAMSLSSSAQNTPPVISSDANTTQKNQSVSGNILTGDYDPDGTTLTANTALIKQPSNGTLFLNGSGGYTYIPANNFTGMDTMVISVCDAGLPLPAMCANDTLIITVMAVNTPPVIANDTATTTQNTSVNGTILTTADSDPDGTTLTANTTLVKAPSHGTIFINASGAYSYIPTTNFLGMDTVVISVCDAGTPLPAICKNDTLVIKVLSANNPPVIVNDTVATRENTAINSTILTPADTDPDGTTLTANTTPVLAPSHGTIFINSNGTYTYIPVHNYTGADTVVVSVCDAGTPLPAICKNDTIFITISLSNSKPVAVNDTAATPEDTQLNSTVTTNDSDPDGPVAIYSLFAHPSHGTLSLNINGTYAYAPAVNYNGADSFSYILCDGGTPNLCDTAVVYITVTPVNDAPLANDDNNTATDNTLISGTVSTNDTDIDGPTAIYTVTKPATHGILVLAGGGTYTYLPDSGYTGCDTMIISLCDSGTPNLCDTSLLLICTTTVAVTNHAPLAVNDSVFTLTGMGVIISPLANDSDPDNNTLSAPVVVTLPAHGTVISNPDSTITYSPDSGFAGVDTFSYVTCDNGSPSLCDTAVVVVAVVARPVLIAPRLSGTPIVTQVDSVVSTCIAYTLSTDSSIGTTSVSCAPQHGTVVATLDSAGHQVCTVYTPDSAYHGLDTFCITLCDAQTALCTTATIPVTVNSASHSCYWLKGISPNKDGQNDFFLVNCNDAYPNATLKVFNRWGDQVWDSQGHYTNNFEGDNGRGEVLTDGTYFYIYEFNDGSKDQYAGFIQISR